MIHSDKADKRRDGKKRHWIRWTIAIIVGVLILGVAWFAYTQRNNLKALYLAMTSDTETLQQRQEEQDKKRDEILQQYGLTVPDISQTEGDDTKEDQTEPSTSPGVEESPSGGESDEPLPTPTQEPVPTPTQKPDQGSDQMQAELQAYINQLYQVEARYKAYLDEMVETTKHEFWSLPHDQQTSGNKMEIVRSKLDGLMAQENACDAEVETILSNMQAVLKQYGQSTELVDEIRLYYEDSKATWKAAKMTELYS